MLGLPHPLHLPYPLLALQEVQDLLLALGDLLQARLFALGLSKLTVQLPNLVLQLRAHRVTDSHHDHRGRKC
jgi:hypothetical protein